MSWLYLLIAGMFEIVWAVAIKYCEGLKLNMPLIIVITSMFLSCFFLWLATKTIPMSVAYAVWTGIGIVGVFVYGIEDLARLLSLSEEDKKNPKYLSVDGLFGVYSNIDALRANGAKYLTVPTPSHRIVEIPIPK